MPKGVLLDTSFFLRFLNVNDPLFKNADGYFRYFLGNEYILNISAVSIAEYCVGGTIDQLPLRNLKLFPSTWIMQNAAVNLPEYFIRNEEPGT